MSDVCLNPHPTFELTLKCKETGAVVKTWQLRMISDPEAQYPQYQTFIDTMDKYDAEMPCNCSNCLNRLRLRLRLRRINEQRDS